ncbi:MAG: hypothetical protein LLG04_02350 [Parachlamydia sp.]|nr:hypothetical protein [Parachlamydia sp.]
MRKYIKYLVLLALVWALAYGVGRIYYRTTGGFTISNITYDLPYDARWEMRSPDEDEAHAVEAILHQPFHYLGKGCQSYVFVSEDNRYVLKFFKYQRFRPKAWLPYMTFIPGMEGYLQSKSECKKRKLESVFSSWKIAYEDLLPETGVLFVHLNKTQLNMTKGQREKPFVIYDKMGWEHSLNLNDYEYLLQRKAKLLCPTLDGLMAQGKVYEAKQLLDRLIQMLLSEYHRGYADNDHALMQNTGVLDGRPVHIDVGQFVKNDKVRDPEVYNHELFNKTWKFRKWLSENHPELASHLEMLLRQVMGDEAFSALKPRLNKASMGVLSHHAD